MSDVEAISLVEASKQALETLEENRHLIEEHERSYYLALYDSRIHALRTAIAQAESRASEAAEKTDNSGPINDGWQLSVSDGHSGRGVYAYMTEYPEEGAVFLMPIEQAEKQEPVAWLCGPDENGLYGLPLSEGTCKKCFPVYTTPPAAQPAPVQEPIRRVYICQSCDFPYADQPPSSCDCMGDEEYTEAYIYTTPPAAQPAYTKEDLDRAFSAGLVEGEKLTIEETAAQRQWVGLTDQEVQWIYDNGRTPAGMIDIAEAKLREKNGG